MSDRQANLERIISRLTPGLKVVLTTHVNADGDGAGSEAALAGWLRRSGLQPVIVNPTPFPESYAFLLDGIPAWTPADEPGGAYRRRDHDRRRERVGRPADDQRHTK